MAEDGRWDQLGRVRHDRESSHVGVHRGAHRAYTFEAKGGTAPLRSSHED